MIEKTNNPRPDVIPATEKVAKSSPEDNEKPATPKNPLDVTNVPLGYSGEPEGAGSAYSDSVVLSDEAKRIIDEGKE